MLSMLLLTLTICSTGWVSASGAVSAIRQVAARVAIFRVWLVHVIRWDSFLCGVKGGNIGGNACLSAGSPIGSIGRRKGVAGIKRKP
jgi:hypothetical protein